MSGRPGQRGFTLFEVLAVTVLIGVISIVAARLYTSSLSVQRKYTAEHDMHTAAVQLIAELSGGFTHSGMEYVGVREAMEVVVSTGPRIKLTDDRNPSVEIVYEWNTGSKQITRRIGPAGVGTPSVVLRHVEHFGVACDANNILSLHFELVGSGTPVPRVSVDSSVRPRNAIADCGGL